MEYVTRGPEYMLADVAKTSTRATKNTAKVLHGTNKLTNSPRQLTQM